jgi:hypothetical protein
MQVPHYVPWINVLRGGLNAVLAWVALLACILSFTVEWEYDHGHPVWHDEEYRRIVTVVGYALCYTLTMYLQPHDRDSSWYAALHDAISNRTAGAVGSMCCCTPAACAA